MRKASAGVSKRGDLGRRCGSGAAVFRVLVLLLLAGVIPTTGARAAVSTVNVPLDHWSYAALDKLDGFGLLHSDLQGTRPFTRMEVARLVNEALLEKQTSGREVPALVNQLLERFKREFSDELGAFDVGAQPPARSAFKPLDEFQARYVYTDGEPRRFRGFENIRRIDATEGTPLVYNNDGVTYREHHNASFQFSTYGRWANMFSGYIQPIVLFRQSRGMYEGDDEIDAELLKGYAKFTPWDFFELQAGRDSMWWGQGRHGALILTNNAQPLDFVRLSNATPTLLPWLFRYLGPFKYSLILSRLEDHRVLAEGRPREVNISDVSLFGMRFDFKPLPWLELGASSTSMFGGEGRPDLGAEDILDIIGFQSGNSNKELNQLAAIDFRVQLPFLRNSEFYGEFGGEDTGGSQFAEEFLFGDIGYLFGVYVPRLTDDGKTDLRIEYANTSHRVDDTPGFWYGHVIYRSGYTNEDMIMGHHMDGDAMDLFARVTRNIREDLIVGVDYDYMARGMRLADHEEQINQFGADVTYDVNEWLTVSARYGFELVDNFNLRAGVDRENHLLMTTFKMHF